LPFDYGLFIMRASLRGSEEVDLAAAQPIHPNHAAMTGLSSIEKLLSFHGQQCGRSVVGGAGALGMFVGAPPGAGAS
jgi:hypothetical protein